jgi:crossover junction endodeoxyribonuclease RuvC
MLVLGIDPGIAITGFGLVRSGEDSSLEAIDYGAILTSADTPLPLRLVQLYQSLQEIIQLHQPDTSAVEKLFFARNVKTGIAVGQARGVALLALAQNQIGISEYSPNEIKLAVAGYGKAEKGQIQDMVQILLKLDEIPKPDDAADALAVAICHLHSVTTQNLYSEGSK